MTKKLAKVIKNLGLEPIAVGEFDGFKIFEEYAIVFQDAASSNSVTLFKAYKRLVHAEGLLPIGDEKAYMGLISGLTHSYQTLKEIEDAGAPAKLKIRTEHASGYHGRGISISAKFSGNNDASPDDMHISKSMYFPFHTTASWSIKKVGDTKWMSRTDAEVKELLLRNLTRERPVNFLEFVAMWNSNPSIGLLSKTSPNTAQLTVGDCAIRLMGGDKIKISTIGQIDAEFLAAVIDNINATKDIRKKRNAELVTQASAQEIGIF